MSALPAILFGALFPLVAAWSAGRFLLRRIPAGPVQTAGIGAAAISVAVFFLLAAGVADKLAFGILGVAALVPLGWLRPRVPRLPRLPLAGWLIVPFALIYLIHALAPEIGPDAITYHLGLIAESLRLRGFPERVGFYEMLPQGLEMLFAFAFAFGGASAAKLIHFAFLLGTIPLMLDIARRMKLNESAGWIAGGIYFCTPVAGISGTSAFNDAALVFYVVLTADFLLAWWHSSDDRYLVPAGIAAGFCYAVKVSGLLVPVLAVLVVSIRRRWRAPLLVAAGAAAMIAPWMARSAYATGNPFAPLFNGLFPNQYFHVATERNLAGWLGSYGGTVTLAQAPWELAFGGAKLQGLIGPILFLLPLALIGIRRPQVRWLLAAGGVLAVPWFFNIGARFLMPALPFFALALAAILPSRVGVGLLAAHAIASWPSVIPEYADHAGWYLGETPWAAALRLEPEDAYLRRVLPEFEIARMVEENTRPGDRILDLISAANLYTTRELIGDWHSALGDRLSKALGMAVAPDSVMLSDARASWTERPLTALRIRQTARADHFWTIHEIELERGASSIAPSRRWRLSASPNVWEAPLALDRNLASRWTTWEPATPRMFFEIEFDGPLQLSGLNLVGWRPESRIRLDIEGRDSNGGWTLLARDPKAQPRPALNLRKSAVSLVRRAGIRYILCAFGHEGFSRVGRSMSEQPGDWGVEVAASLGGIFLFRVLDR